MLNKNSSFSIWLRYLEKYNKKKISDLIKLKSIAKKLDLLAPKPFIFTVGGTNGKGTTCAMLERLLLNSGYRVGLYTSPHLLNYVERVRINGNTLDEEEHISSFYKIELEKKSNFLTYFEFITLSSLILFKRYLLDIIILEVGLGGRLDATNIIDSNLSIITNIGIDHTSILGNHRSDIAREKAGIFRKNKISVIGEKHIPNSMIKIAQEKKTILKKINVDWFWRENSNCWDFIHTNTKFYNLPITHIPISNTAIALAALYYTNFKIHEKIIRESISSVQLPGRFQIISSYPSIILDVAHNPASSLYLSRKIDKLNIKGKLYAIVGMLRDKDLSGIVYPLINKVDYWYAAPLKTHRSASINQLKKNLPLHNTYILHSIEEAYKKICVSIRKQDIIVVFGSFITISEFILSKTIQKHIKKI